MPSISPKATWRGDEAARGQGKVELLSAGQELELPFGVCSTESFSAEAWQPWVLGRVCPGLGSGNFQKQGKRLEGGKSKARLCVHLRNTKLQSTRGVRGVEGLTRGMREGLAVPPGDGTLKDAQCQPNKFIPKAGAGTHTRRKSLLLPSPREKGNTFRGQGMGTSHTPAGTAVQAQGLLLIVPHWHDQIIALYFSLNKANTSWIKTDTDLQEEAAKLLRRAQGYFWTTVWY